MGRALPTPPTRASPAPGYCPGPPRPACKVEAVLPLIRLSQEPGLPGWYSAVVGSRSVELLWGCPGVSIPGIHVTVAEVIRLLDVSLRRAWACSRYGWILRIVSYSTDFRQGHSCAVDATAAPEILLLQLPDSLTALAAQHGCLDACRRGRCMCSRRRGHHPDMPPASSRCLISREPTCDRPAAPRGGLEVSIGMHAVQAKHSRCHQHARLDRSGVKRMHPADRHLSAFKPCSLFSCFPSCGQDKTTCCIEMR